MFNILRRIEACGDFQSEHLDVEAPAALDVIALQRAVGKSLRHVAAAGKSFCSMSGLSQWPAVCARPCRAPPGL